MAIQEQKAIVHSGDVFKCLRDINFTYGGFHKKGVCYKVKPGEESYYIVNYHDYEIQFFHQVLRSGDKGRRERK
jgi:hypothetical protein